jgi:hypothetical protein
VRETVQKPGDTAVNGEQSFRQIVDQLVCANVFGLEWSP